MHLSIKNILILICVLSSQIVQAQDKTSTELSEYIIEEFTLPGGQLFNNVNCITEGPYGFLWFATHGGVVRYDGYEFVTFTANPADTIAPTTSLTFPYTEHLYWDKDDMLWVSSYGGGLFRFDPSTETFDHFKYDEDDPTTISFPRVMWVQEDIDGRLWITTEHGINRFDRETETFKRYYPFEGPENLRDNTFRNIYLDKRGTLWISGGNAPWQSDISGLLKYDKSTDSFIKYVHDPNDPTTLSSSSTRGLLEDRNGNFWVGNSLGLQQMDRDQGTFTSYNYSESHPYAPGEESGINSIAFSLLEDQEGALWIGSMSQIDKPSNLLKYDPVTQTVTNFPLLRSAWYLHQSNDGTLWVAGAGISGKVSRIKPKSKIYELSKSPNYVEAYNQVRQEIQKGNRKLGSGFYTGMGLATFGFDQTTGVMWGTHVGAYGTVVGGGEATPILSSYDPESKELSFYHLPELNLTRDNSLPGNIRGVTGLAVDQLGRVWSSGASENVGLFCFDPKTQKVVQYLHDPEDSTSLSSNFVIDIYQDPQQGDLYVSTYDREINRVNPATGQIKRLNLTNMDLLAYDNNPLTSVWHEGDIWIAGEIGSGEVEYMVKYNPDTEEKEWIPIPGLSPTGWIQDMDWTAGCEHIAFVSGDNGIGYIDPFNYQVNLLNTNNGLFPNDDTRAVLMTEDDIVIFSTETGEYILHYPSGEIETIQKTNANRGRLGDGARAPDGKLYFNTIDGSWDVIDPAVIQSGASLDVANLALVDLYVLGEKQIPGKSNTLSQPLWITDKVSLPHTAENFSLRFTDFNYRGGNTSYLYRLYPYEDWHTTTGSPVANYYKIPAGDYEFQIKSIDSSNDADNTALSVKLSILPPWWRTWWAYLGYVLLGGLSIGYFVKYQRERAIQLERERIKDRELEQAKKLEVAYNKLKESEREAQIEAALERVRARTMAMHQSSELSDVSTVLFKELSPYCDDILASGVVLCDREPPEQWMCSPEMKMLPPVHIPKDLDKVIFNLYQAWKKGKELYSESIHGEELKAHNAALMALPEMQAIFEHAPKDIKLPEAQTNYAAVFKQGYLLFITEKPFEDEELFIRFAKVFEQTYTRFLDLQKAEAQAREAQIEAALERTRSRAMAMHQSSELAEVVVLLLGQLRDLGLPLSMCFINIVRRKSKQIETWITFEGDLHPQVVNLPLEEYIKLENKSLALNRNTDFISFTLNDELLIEYNQGLANLSGDDVFISQEFPAFRDTLLSTTSYGSIGICTDDREMPSEARQVLPRFAKVFDQTYTRFLDLQKAEAQAREAKIEAALERVRAASMAMQHSSQLIEVNKVLRGQMEALGLLNEFDTVEIQLVNEDSEVVINYQTQDIGINQEWKLEVGVDEMPEFRQFYDDWKANPPNQRKGKLTISEYQGDRFDAILEWTIEKRARTVAEKETLIELGKQVKNDGWYIHYSFFRDGAISIGGNHQLEDGQIAILHRFAATFEQTYTRFLDLQKAEAQAREAQIEAALERIRGRSMAMQSSNELIETAQLMFEQLTSLGIDPWICAFTIFREGTPIADNWASGKVGPLDKMILRHDEEPVLKSIYSDWKKGGSLHINKVEGLKLKKHMEYMLKIKAVEQSVEVLHEQGVSLPNVNIFHCANFKYGYILLGTLVEVPEFHDIFIRFAKAFEQTYTRFLDIRKAEAQAREAQIEAALERVRAASMAMHVTDDLKNVVEVLFEQFKKLDDQIIMAFVGIYHLEEKYIDQWFSPMEEITDEATSLRLPTAPWEETSIKDWKAGKEITHYSVRGKEAVIQYAKEVDAMTGFKGFEKFARERGGENFESTEFNHKYGTLSIVQTRKPTVEEIELVKRFGKSFEQCYVRFKDLQKAEAQAREAQIEAALERVRARAMAMHDTQDLSDVLNVMFDQLQALDFGNYQVMFGILKEGEKIIEYWTKALPGFEFPQMFRVELIDHPFLNTTLQDHKDDQEQRYIVLEGNDKVTWDNHIFKSPDLQNMPEEAKKAMRSLPSINVLQAYLSHGMLLAIGPEPINTDNEDILKRFASAIELTYTRFLDLQKAEKRAREAQIEAALERVRSRTMYMQQSSELRKVVSVMYDEMEALGLAKWGCSIMICHKDKEEYEFWLAEESGSDQSRNYFVKGKEHPVYKDIWTKWEQQSDPFILHHKDEYKREVDKYWLEETDFKHLPDEVKAAVFDINEVYISHATMKHGLLQTVSYENPPENSLMILSRFAIVFEQAYTRFLDLQRAEAQARAIREERDRLDATLSELQSTQAQLIQSEKMASLGELTAGIAHEIQNPLNFVNNFSDVSAELIDEAIEELETDPEEAKEILADLKQNLEKINHHGQRAESIVKGMLQHSRSGAGEKVPTDINALCDEYMRLAYHGLRAKDQSFNADYNLQLDDKIAKIEVVPQDMSRVILNIVTNAFQACHELSQEKKDTAYTPKVVCSTSLSPLPWRQAGLRESEGGITITISDNGGGIPQDVIDKVFQPFFTTKPTGQGTGLGLSMAYDIVKAHGGELRVESVEGEGSTFTIQIPI